jgi:hypothetical protein
MVRSRNLHILKNFESWMNCEMLLKMVILIWCQWKKIKTKNYAKIVFLSKIGVLLSKNFVVEKPVNKLLLLMKTAIKSGMMAQNCQMMVLINLSRIPNLFDLGFQVNKVNINHKIEVNDLSKLA